MSRTMKGAGRNLGRLQTNNNRIRQLEEELKRSRSASRRLLGMVLALQDEVARLTPLAERAYVDVLTGLPNRAAFDIAIEREIARAVREISEPVTLVMIDIDRFKGVNDRFGHGVGDQVLKLFAQTLKESVRAVDFVARLGGEEFVCILPHADEFDASYFMERLRASVEEKVRLTVKRENGACEPLAVTASFGVAVWRRGESPEAFIERADQAMYRAKDGGRNRVEFAD